MSTKTIFKSKLQYNQPWDSKSEEDVQGGLQQYVELPEQVALCPLLATSNH